MATKYIQKSKDGKWRVTNSHAEKATAIFDTQKEAVMHAAGMKSTSAIKLKNSKGKFRKLSNWDTAGGPSPKQKQIKDQEIKPKKSKDSKIDWKLIKSKIDPMYVITISISLIICIILGLYFGGAF